MTEFSALLPARVTGQLGEAVRERYRPDQVAELLGLAGAAARARSDLAGLDRMTRAASPIETMIRLFLLGRPVTPAQAAAALLPLALPDALSAGLLERVGDQVRARLAVHPLAEPDGPAWWVLSDFGTDLRDGRLEAGHVLGVGSAATTLAQATIRRPVRRALDLGIGCGVQALHLSRHCDQVVGTDLDRRALAFAASTAELNGQRWQLRAGSLLEPVAEDCFDLIVCNPPFIVGPGFRPGQDGFSYRDSGLAGDAVCARLLAELPARLNVGGTAQLLANWIIGQDQPWPDRLAGWLPELGCDVWIWQREVAEPAEYVAMWLRDAGERPGTESWQRGYDHWLDWFVENRVAGIGMGMVHLRRTDASGPTVRCEDVRQPYQLPIGAAVADWFDRQQWLRTVELPAARLAPARDLVLDSRALLSATGWEPAISSLRQSHGMRWELEVDQAVAGLVAASSQQLPLSVLLGLVAASVGAPADQVAEALLPVVRDLVERGFLVPAGAS
ncbi:MAG: methyltransferase [Jatrophihabitantaceae bacterium]